jgi:hypothetical protein
MTRQCHKFSKFAYFHEFYELAKEKEKKENDGGNNKVVKEKERLARG